jgi:hypothetical protein
MLNRSILAFLRFSRSGVYVNMARADRALFLSGSPVKFVGKNTFPIALMAISVQECFLRSPGLYGSSTTLPVYKITGHPFPQEWRRDVSLWCSLLGFEEGIEVAGPVGPLGVTFQTKTPSKTGTMSQGLGPFLASCCSLMTLTQHRALSSLANPSIPFACLTWPLRPASTASLIKRLTLLKYLVCVHRFQGLCS